MTKTQLLFLVSLLFIANGCFNNDEEPVYEEIEGVVLSNGEPVDKADIHIKNNFDPGGFVNEEPRDEYTVNFNAPVSRVYKISLFRHLADSIITTFFDDTLSSGPQEIIVPDSLLSNGIFGYEISTEAGVLTGNLFLVNQPDSLLPGKLPFDQTNIRGEFTLNPDELALGQSFSTSRGGGFEITDSLQIIVTQDSTVLGKQSVKVEPNQANFFEIILD